MFRTRLASKMIAALLGLAGVGGCAQPLYIDQADKERATQVLPPVDLENHPHDPIAPSLVDRGLSPATVMDPSRPPRPITLQECLAIAIECGNVGSRNGASVINGGVLIDDNLGQANINPEGGSVVGGTDTIRAFVLDPASIGTSIERSLSKFDARWITSLSWSNNDQAVLNLQQSFNNGESAALSTTFAKPLPTGGLAGITFSTNYQNLSNPPSNSSFVTLPTSYTPRVQFIFEQPLLRGFGVEINQLTSQHPGSLLLGNLGPSGGQSNEGILITRLRYDQSKAEFCKVINQLLLNVECAYWDLYAAYYNLYAQENTLKQAFDLYVVLKKRVEAGSERPQSLYQTAAQYWLFRQQVIAARQQIFTAERALRGLLGMNSFSDGQRLVPADLPVLAPFIPDYFEMANEALALRPELLQARMELKFHQLDLLISKNNRRPDLRSFASYDINGLGQRLDGSPTTVVNGVERPNNAFASLGSNNFNSWQIGLRLDVPLGFRDANGAVRLRRLQIARAYWQLQDFERKCLENLTNIHREVIFNQEFMKIARQRRKDLETTLELQQKFVIAGSWDVNSLFNILQVQRDVADAVAREFASIASYNKSLAALEWSKGTIQSYNNVSIAEAPLPPLAAKKAAEHFRDRARALKLREREAPGLFPDMAAADQPYNSTFDSTNLPPLGTDPNAVPPTAPLKPDAKPMTPNAPNAPNAPKAPTGPIAQGEMPAGVSPWPTSVSPASGAAPAEEPAFKPVGTVNIPRRGAGPAKP